jgi:tetratricopeptide (TPR) repeat protein
VFGAAPARSLARTLHDRTQGFPLFVEELCTALAAAGRVVDTGTGLELVGGDQLPLPDTLRDAILARAERLSTDARRVLEVASVAGPRLDLALVAELAGEAAIDEPVSAGILVEVEPGVAAFRHTLAREAFYRDIPWGRRRELHLRLAELLDERGARPAVLAEHWLAAQRPAPARLALLAAAQEFHAAHAYRDALEWCRRALDLWPASEEDGRLALLDRLGRCAELSGELGAAARAWEEVAEARRAEDDTGAVTELERRLAVVYDLQGSSERALAARQRAAEGFAHLGRDADAAAELLAAASQLEAMGSLTAALELVERGAVHAERAQRRDLVAHALGLEGSIRAKLGQLDDGARLARDGLSIALTESLTEAATELYLRLAAVLENAADLGGAERLYGEAHDFCVANASPEAAQVCLVCLAYILWETGRWGEAEKLERRIIASPQSPPGVLAAATAALGIFRAARGRARGTRRLLVEGLAYAQRNHRLRFELNSLVGLAWLEELEGAEAAAAKRYREIVRRCRGAEDLHYAPMALRWAVTFFAARGDESDARACAAALADMAAATTNRETLATLAHALGEIALLAREPDNAVVEFGRSLDLLRELELPYQRVHAQLRAAAGLAACRGGGERGRRAPDGRLPQRAQARGAAAGGSGGARARGARRAGRRTARTPRRRPPRARGPHASRARGAALRRGRADQPRDRARALPQPAHRRHARPQHPREARLPVPRRGDATRRRVGPRRLRTRHRPARTTAISRMNAARCAINVGLPDREAESASTRRTSPCPNALGSSSLWPASQSLRSPAPRSPPPRPASRPTCSPEGLRGSCTPSTTASASKPATVSRPTLPSRPSRSTPEGRRDGITIPASSWSSFSPGP